VVLARRLAGTLKAKSGDTLRFSWKGRYDTAGGAIRYVVTGIADDSAPVPDDVLLVNERDLQGLLSAASRRAAAGGLETDA
jgi:hypothetical protein